MLIVSKRLTLQHYSSTDFDDFKAILMNDLVMKHIVGKGHDLKNTRKKFENALAENAKRKLTGFFNVKLLSSNELVGFSKLVFTDQDELEVGYALLEKQWGLGYASEITSTLVKHAQKHFPTTEIIGIVNLNNDASSRVLEKQHFKLEKSTILDNEEVKIYKFLK